MYNMYVPSFPHYSVINILCLLHVLNVIHAQQVAPVINNNYLSATATPPPVSRQITTFGHREKGDSLIYRYMYASSPAAGENGTVQRDLPYPPINKKASMSDITCVQTIDIRTEYGGGMASIVSGGVGEHNVTVRLTSFKNKGFSFIVNIYGKDQKSQPQTQQARPASTATRATSFRGSDDVDAFYLCASSSSAADLDQIGECVRRSSELIRATDESSPLSQMQPQLTQEALADGRRSEPLTFSVQNVTDTIPSGSVAAKSVIGNSSSSPIDVPRIDPIRARQILSRIL